MAIKTGIIFFTLLLSCLAVPVPKDDMSIFFPESSQERIVGGNPAPIGAHPWMVALYTGRFIRSFRCGGSIITRRTVLTAAHCIITVQPRQLLLTVGTNQWNFGGQEYTASGFSIHTEYDGEFVKNDIAVIYTTNIIVFNNLVHAITLTFNNVGGGIQSRVAGWGANRPGGPAQSELMELNVTTITGQQCIDDIRQAAIDLDIRAPHVDPAIELCTFHSVGTAVCQGDSGSALVRRDTGQQIGIVSWVFPCALGAPDVFVRVSGFQSWILLNAR